MLGFKPGIIFLGFFLIVGAVFLGSGVFIIIITPSVHYSDPIENFNERVYQWNKYKLSEFSQWSFSISYRDTIIDLHSDFSPDKEQFSDIFHQLSAYRSFKYSLLNSAQLFNKTTIHFTPDLKISFQFGSKKITQVYNNNFSILKDTSKIESRAFILHQLPEEHVVEPNNNSNFCTYGYSYNGKCYALFRLNQICIKVSQISFEKIQVNNEYGGIGCEPGIANFQSELGPWNHASYSIVEPKYQNQTLDSSVTINFDNFAIIVRSFDDPYIFAQYLTNGTLNFSELEEPNNLAVVRLLLGFGQIVLGFLLLALSLSCCVVCCVCKRTRKLLIDDLEEEHKRLLQMQQEESSTSWKKYLRSQLETDE